MRIAMLAPFEETVPPKKYGGTELVVSNLSNRLVKLGHEVDVYCVEGSEVSGNLISIFKEPIRGEDQKRRDNLKLIGVGRVVKHLLGKKYDVIHNHIGWRFLPFASLFTGVVTTLHGPVRETPARVVYETLPGLNYVSISKNQQIGLNLNYVGNVYNGIEVSKFKFNDKPKDYLAFLGRMSPEKGPVEAIIAAKKAGVNLVMAAKVDKVDEAYFKSEIEPKIDGKQIIFIGEADHPKKVELLSGARALLAPIQWDEPFGLYFVEAMVCGAPVLTLDRGSTREVIIDKKTGFISKDLDQLVNSVQMIGQIKRKDCHDHVVSRFSVEAMTQNYLKVYEQIRERQEKKEVSSLGLVYPSA